MSPFPALALALVVQGGSTSESAPKALFEFPPGDVARAVGGLEPGTIPAETPVDLGQKGQVPALPADAWTRAATWETWSELVELESRSVTPDSERRARLALLSAAQGRAEDAWRHCAAIRDEAWLAAVLPRFLPGVPAGSPSGLGGAAGPLPDGVVLSPSLPPSARAARTDGRVDRRAMSIRSFQVGRAFVSLKVSVEAEGVQVDVRHLAGESAKLLILIPASPDYDYADEYVDWYRMDVKREPHAIEVKPGEAEHTIYGRFEPRTHVEHVRVPRTLPGSVREGGVWFTIHEGDAERALVARIAETLEKRSFGFHAGVRAPHAAPKRWSGVTFALEDAATRAEKLAWLASAIEEFVLAPPPR